MSWHFTLSDGNHSVSSASQHSRAPGSQKKEQNAPKLDKAQCSFCCYSETRPSLSPTHICKIINRCLKSLLRPAYRKHTLSLPHCIIPFAQSPRLAPFLCISSIPSPLLTCRMQSGHKHMQILPVKITERTDSHRLTSVRRLISFQQNHCHQRHIAPSCFVFFADAAFALLWHL